MKNRQHTPLSKERILATALHLIDTQGLRRLTMRRLGDALEVEAMAIYHHFPRGKEALLDALVEHVSTVAAEPPSDADWRAPLRAWARSLRSRLCAHPELLPLLITRPTTSQAALTTADTQRAAFEQAGLRGAVIPIATHTLTSYVIGSTALEIRAARQPGTANGRPTEPASATERHFEAGLEAVFAGIAPGTR